MNSSSTISWMTVRLFTISNKPGMKLWLLTFEADARSVNHVEQHQHLCGTLCHLLGSPQVAPRDPWFPVYHILHFDRLRYLLGQIVRRTPSHGLSSTSQHGWVKEKWMNFAAAGSKFSAITQCGLRLLSSMLLHSQHPTRELHHPAKNLHRLEINSPHKINCNLKTKMIHNVPEYKK